MKGRNVEVDARMELAGEKLEGHSNVEKTFWHQKAILSSVNGKRKE